MTRTWSCEQCGRETVDRESKCDYCGRAMCSRCTGVHDGECPYDDPECELSPDITAFLKMVEEKSYLPTPHTAFLWGVEYARGQSAITPEQEKKLKALEASKGEPDGDTLRRISWLQKNGPTYGPLANWKGLVALAQLEAMEAEGEYHHPTVVVTPEQKAKLEELKGELCEDDLDDLVLIVHDEEASAIVNSGLDGSIEFLLSAIGPENTISEIEKVIESNRHER